MNFENLTMAPIDKDLIVPERLDKNEKKWINNYHKTVFKNLITSMNKVEALEKKVESNASTVNIINKMFWIVMAAAATAITGMLIMQ